jgi:threonine synthase
VTIASLAKLAASGVVSPRERVVALVTGHGLKTVEALASSVGPTVTIDPALADFHAALSEEILDQPSIRQERAR